MKKNENSIYDIVDENFMSNFSGKHIGFMKDYYYKVYYKEKNPATRSFFYKYET